MVVYTCEWFFLKLFSPYIQFKRVRERERDREREREMDRLIQSCRLCQNNTQNSLFQKLRQTFLHFIRIFSVLLNSVSQSQTSPVKGWLMANSLLTALQQHWNNICAHYHSCQELQERELWSGIMASLKAQLWKMTTNTKTNIKAKK